MKRTFAMIVMATLILSGAAAAHAGKRVTTGSSGLTEMVECTVINVSETKPVIVDIRVRNAFGGVVTQLPAQNIPPLSRGLVAFSATDLWCEFVVISGSTKQLRANSVMYENGAVIGTEAAR
ncbi:MAG TPA: hypothetical protein VEL28_11515 [Candidatus Binatia bacterium]|nr:hypothetical protein [Candidatus Binatia bacterium]